MANFPEENAIITVFKAIAHSERLRNEIVLKGGYALKHIYNSPRASVDLDFTEIENYSLKSDKHLQKLLEEIVAELDTHLKNVMHEYDFTDMLVQSSSVEPAKRDVREHPSFEIKVGYSRKKTGAAPYSDIVKLEISLNDVVCEYQYFQEGKNRLRVSSLNDIIAEKLRALLQQVERNRYRPRDVFDIWFFHTRAPQLFDYQKISKFLIEKSQGKLSPDLVRKHVFHSKEVKKRASQDYTSLKDTVSGIPLPSFEDAFGEVLNLVERLSIPD
ncbi:MAG: nucleotidyl transferase AbiEii/AbiGii toxin family protein [Balneolaceae bacterium]|nr:nucleotidyl transferase AbiEii/AbiGii toxin family protein [Balneolaceae bacterium]